MPDVSSPVSDPMDRIRRLSLIMQVVVIVGSLLVELGLVWIWLSPEIIMSVVLEHLGLSGSDVVLDVRARVLGFLISTLPFSLLFYALYQAFCLFAGYRRGEFFTSRAARRLRHIALSVIGGIFLKPLVQAALSAALTYGAGHGNRLIVMGFSSQGYLMGALGGLLLAIAYVMAEAVRIAEENQKII